MLHELMWENYYHWIYIFLVFTPTSVQTVSKCSKVDVCKCSTDEGTIDLWSLAGTPSNIPRFKDISIKGGKGFTADWNTCNKWTAETPPSTTASNCQNNAVCFKFVGLFADIGDQETAGYSFSSTSGACVLSLTGKPFPKTGIPKSSSTHITLQCDSHEEGRLESLEEPINVPGVDDFRVPLTLYSKYACPVKSGLSIGSILVIIFISVLVVYLVGGILFNKYRKGATGKEMIPNVNFWTDFPLLVKDGVVFSYQCCRNVCSRKQSSYESI